MTSIEADARPEDGRELKFRALANDLRARIVRGVWEPGAKLPTEKQLSVDHDLSMTTVRRALDELVEQRLVVRRQGSGTFVAKTPPRSRDTLSVGVLVPSTTQYYPQVLAGIETTLSGASARMMLACYHYDSSEEDRDIASLVDGGVDGLLLAPDLTTPADPAARLEELLRLPVPVVLLERRLFDAGPADRAEYVRTDHEAGAFDAVSHLATLGHERVALICRHPNPTGNWVVRGYNAAVTDLDLARIDPVLAASDDWSPGRADEALAELLRSRATAAVVFGDREAALLEGAARRAGVRVPEDLALVAYDDESADVAEIPLTAVSPPKHTLGRLGAQVLLTRLSDGDAAPVHQINLRPRVVIRDSCGARLRGAR
ncbi:GntR family transcriptional regulator [Georgenia subflava]|uniref:GntR family transcriptional regulator n=1 Tax=Georgenia subflava TaxID=1622177 RepID=A0A6N7ELZ7_9MICO|nr:substrate-binding domain-containing protein [Georgenia subflava]MPV38148.1 GntR family transcriptional regulator [Georgenia subflava]